MIQENIPVKILLVKPRAELRVPRMLQNFLHLEPLELEIIAGGLDAHEKVKILDLGVEKKNQFKVFAKALKDWQPDIIGLTGYSTNLSTMKQLARIAKEFSPQIITVAGGIHATLLPVDFAKSHFDIVVRGEGSQVLNEIVRRFKNQEPLFFGDAALSPTDPSFTHKAAQPPPEYPPIEKIPRPRRDLVDRKRYFCIWTSSHTPRMDKLFPQVASMRTSIGCAFSCSFCVIHQLMHHKYLQRDPQDVVDEIQGLQENHIYFLDDEMFLNAQRCIAIAQLLIDRGIKKEYISWARSDTIVKHPEVFKLWKQAGLSTVYVGLESMEEDKLQEYKKRLPVETNRKAIAILKEIGITLHAAFIVHQNFTDEDFIQLRKETVKICPAEVSFTVLSPSPATAFWQESKEKFICDPYYYYDCMHTILPTRLPLRKFYRRFAFLTATALRLNPLRVNRIKVPFKDFLRALDCGAKYIYAQHMIYRDYLPGRKKEFISGDTLLNSNKTDELSVVSPE